MRWRGAISTAAVARPLRPQLRGADQYRWRDVLFGNVQQAQAMQEGAGPREEVSATTGMANTMPITTGAIHAASDGDTAQASTPMKGAEHTQATVAADQCQPRDAAVVTLLRIQPESRPDNTSATPRDCTYITTGAISAASTVSTSIDTKARIAPPQPRRVDGSSSIAR